MKLSESREGVLLAAMPGPGTEEAGSLLRTMTGNFTVNEQHKTLSPTEGADGLAEGRGTHLLILYPDPPEALAEAIRGGCTPTESAMKWQKRMEPALTACRRDRRNTTLVNARVVRDAPAKLGQLLSQRIGIALQTPANDKHLSQGIYDPLMQLLASYILANTPEITSFAGELMASSLSPGASERSCNLVYSAYEAICNIDKNATNTQALKNTLNLKEAENETLEEERDLLLGQVFNIQKRLEKEAAESEEKSKSILALSREKNNLKENLDRIRSSRSWKLTAPLRSVNRPTPKKSGKRA